MAGESRRTLDPGQSPPEFARCARGFRVASRAGIPVALAWQSTRRCHFVVKERADLFAPRGRSSYLRTPPTRTRRRRRPLPRKEDSMRNATIVMSFLSVVLIVGCIALFSKTRRDA